MTCLPPPILLPPFNACEVFSSFFRPSTIRSTTVVAEPRRFDYGRHATPHSDGRTTTGTRRHTIVAGLNRYTADTIIFPKSVIRIVSRFSAPNRMDFAHREVHQGINISSQAVNELLKMEITLCEAPFSCNLFF